MPKDWAAASPPLDILGGLPAGERWNFRRGPDFDVWICRYRMADADVQVGFYWGGFPQVDPPSTNLVPGLVGGIPVLWWKREQVDYEISWDAIIPVQIGSARRFVHIWITSLHPQRVEDAAALLRSVRFAS